MRRRLMAMVLLTALVLSACSGTTDADVGVVSLEDQLLAFAACMRENGYDMPDPDRSNFGPGGSAGGPGGGGMLGALDADDPDYHAALAQCQEFLPGVGPGSGLGGGTP